jgi:hypothetical protein
MIGWSGFSLCGHNLVLLVCILIAIIIYNYLQINQMRDFE